VLALATNSVDNLSRVFIPEMLRLDPPRSPIILATVERFDRLLPGGFLRIIAVEEHYRTASITKATASDPYVKALDGRGGDHLARLDDLGPMRLSDMDSAGIDVQVLSHTLPATERLDAATAIPLAREANDILADAVARHPKRLVGFATLPLTAVEAAADELERAVGKLGLRGALINGLPGGRFMDDRSFWPIFERAERLGVPLYLHPAVPPPSVLEAYYSGFSPPVNFWLATAAWGWHMEVGLHALRLILAGVFDRFPRLQIILGHMGEGLPSMIWRSNCKLTQKSSKLEKPLQDYFLEHFYVTTSGFFSVTALLNLQLVLGTDRILFAVDYPYNSNKDGRAFLEAAPISRADKEKIAHGNAERLLRLDPS
jgi:uncharacterized protein